MICWVCSTQGQATCRFCGRATCKLHAKTQPYPLQVWRTATGLRGLAVEDAIWCGVCKRTDQPVDLAWLDPQASDK